MSVLDALGCKVVTVAGRPASIICFGLPGSGEEAHLVVVQAGDAKASGPVFAGRDGWNYVTWNEDGRSLMLASRAPVDELRRIFV
jgi:hypothetical protein